MDGEFWTESLLFVACHADDEDDVSSASCFLVCRCESASSITHDLLIQVHANKHRLCCVVNFTVVVLCVVLFTYFTVQIHSILCTFTGKPKGMPE